MGTEWEFVILDRKNKIVIRDLTKYIVPDRLKDIITILLNMLENHTILVN
jgi:hypothetical protein